MSSRLANDEKIRPELFLWSGAISRQRIAEWLTERRLRIPDDLLSLWTRTGGGDLFETETIFAPFSGDATNDVDMMNAFHRSRGLGAGYLVVHDGLALTAIRLDDGKWILLDRDDYRELWEYDSLEDWYVSLLRAEYAERYGLPVV